MVIILLLYIALWSFLGSFKFFLMLWFLDDGKMDDYGDG
jgi:hypothetical protein